MRCNAYVEDLACSRAKTTFLKWWMRMCGVSPCRPTGQPKHVRMARHGSGWTPWCALHRPPPPSHKRHHPCLPCLHLQSAAEAGTRNSNARPHTEASPPAQGAATGPLGVGRAGEDASDNKDAGDPADPGPEEPTEWVEMVNRVSSVHGYTWGSVVLEQ